MDFINSLGALALATRLKRLSDKLGQDVSRVYKEQNLDFESRWFLVMALLEKKGTLSVVEISDSLKLSHPAIVQFTAQMHERGLIVSVYDQFDARKRLISLSDEGKQLMTKLKPLLAIIKEQNEAWLSEAGSDFLALISRLEDSLGFKSMYERVTGAINQE
ncbi:MarR family winged helix-turn-helix transcriptional regulator [Hufsiella ginkgonis]|uniref:MarR family transcriptional regulator n=1 Tax=Hufsiella ginkgonis TaxID=2695274 RepID=A0A7K1XVA2_9SPHI|nr:MarR family transcriptional regulator [Hufsiella ginkgonis]MXV14933.1 MarR family transcriptional regulator [Hufsiella ginkgonis]